MLYKVRCKKCKNILELDVDLDVVSSDERNMGAELLYQGMVDEICECGNNIDLTVEANEYPAGADIEIYNVNVNGGSLINS